jgi:hypothetical protein
MSHMRFWKVAIQIAGLLVFIGCFASTSSAQCTAQVTPHAVIFGPQAVGVPSPVITVTFRVLTGSCTLTGFSLSGNPRYFSAVKGATNGCTTGTPIIAPGSCTVDTTFTPTAPGGGFHTFLTFNYTGGELPSTSISVDGGDTLVYVSTQTGSQIVKVDPGFPGDFAVVSGNPDDVGFSPEGMTVGPDNKLYITDPSNEVIWRMNQDGTQTERVFAQAGNGGPGAPQGPSFSSSSTGDLYVNTKNSEFAKGTFVIKGAATTPFDFAFNAPTPIAPAQDSCPTMPCFGPISGAGTAFDAADDFLFVEQANGSNPNSVLSVSPPYTPTDTPATVVSGLNQPIGVALNKATGQMFVADKNSGGSGEILASGTGGTTSVYYTFGVNGNLLSPCTNLKNLPTFMQSDGLGNLYVVTSTDPSGLSSPSCGALWVLNPPCSDCGGNPSVSQILDFYQASKTTNAPLNGSQAIGLAFQSSGTQGNPQTTPSSGPGSISPSGGTFTFGWPPTCTPGSNGDIGTCIHTYGLTYPAGMFATGDMVTVIPTYISQADWAARTPTGNPYLGTKIAPITGYQGDGVDYTVSCTNTTTGTCATPLSTNYYTTASSWKSTNTAWCSTGIGGNNPGMLKSEASTPNTFQDVLIFCGDGGPKHIGGSGPTLSGWDNVSGVTGAAPTITITSPGDGATYNQNQVVPAYYSCAPPIAANCFGGPDLVNGTATVQNGSPVDTSTVGTHFFEVTGDVISGPGGSAPGTPAAGSGFTTVLVPKTVKYTVVPGAQATATPANVNFGTFHVPGFGFQFVTVKNIGAAPLSISSVKVTSVSGKDSDDFFALSLCPRTLGAGKSCFILLGFFADEVTANNPQMANLVITATGGSVVVPLSATVVKR